MPKIYAVWSRAHPTENKAGRDKIVAEIKATLKDYPHRSVVVRNALEKTGVAGLLFLAVRWMLLRIFGRPAALQILLFSNRQEIARVCADLKRFDPDVVLIDTIRLITLAEEIRKFAPNLPIVFDMDDLMSRRYGEMARTNTPIYLGFIKKFVPSTIARALSSKIFSNYIYTREEKSLRAAEGRAARIATSVVFVSSVEAQIFRETIWKNSATSVYAFCPPAPRICECTSKIEKPYRFICIGSDQLVQNAETIQYLLSLWKQHKYASPLFIYGKMTKIWATPPNVTFGGFAPNLDEIYTSNSILLAPSFVRGGIKTKVIEAFGLGVPVIGTPITFEGLQLSYPLNFSDLNDFELFLKRIDESDSYLRLAQDVGHAFAKAHCDPENYRERWHGILNSASAAGIMGKVSEPL